MCVSKATSAQETTKLTSHRHPRAFHVWQVWAIILKVKNWWRPMAGCYLVHQKQMLKAEKLRYCCKRAHTHTWCYCKLFEAALAPSLSEIRQQRTIKKGLALQPKAIIAKTLCKSGLRSFAVAELIVSSLNQPILQRPLPKLQNQVGHILLDNLCILGPLFQSL